MGNRKKIKNNFLRMKKRQPQIAQKAPFDSKEENAELFRALDSPLARAMRAEHPDWILTEEALIKLGVTKEYPTDEPQLIRVVPAKADGIRVGDALLYDDGSVGYREDPYAEPEGLKRVRDAEKTYGYSLQEGRPFNIGEAGGPDGPPKED